MVKGNFPEILNEAIKLHSNVWIMECGYLLQILRFLFLKFVGINYWRYEKPHDFESVENYLKKPSQHFNVGSTLFQR